MPLVGSGCRACRLWGERGLLADPEVSPAGPDQLGAQEPASDRQVLSGDLGQLSSGTRTWGGPVASALLAAEDLFLAALPLLQTAEAEEQRLKAGDGRLAAWLSLLPTLAATPRSLAEGFPRCAKRERVG